MNQTAEVYHLRSDRRAARLRFLLPVVMTVCVGGTAVLAYALLIMLPVIHLNEQLALPVR